MRSTYMTVPDNEFFQAFGRLEGKMDVLLNQFTESRKDLESRVRKLEKWQWMVMGGAVALSAVVSTLISLLK